MQLVWTATFYGLVSFSLGQPTLYLGSHILC